jgi:hypothetical protein
MLEERIGVEGETEPKSEKGNSNKNKTSSQFSFQFIHSLKTILSRLSIT